MIGFYAAGAMGQGGGDDWNTVGPWASSSNSPGWSGYTARQLIPNPWKSSPPASFSGSKIRLTLRAANSGSPLVIGKIFVGLAALSGNAYDFDSAPTQLSIGGLPGVTIPVNSEVVTDESSIVLPSDRAIIVSAYLNDGDMRLFAGSSGGYRRFFIFGDDAESTVGVGSYEESLSGFIYMMPKLEVFGS